MSYKIVLVGGDGVGKTNIMQRFKHEKFIEKYHPTDQVIDCTQDVQLQAYDASVNILMQDVPGDERFLMLNRMYIRDTHAALVVYDVTNQKSLEQAEVWVKELREMAPSEVVIGLCGNKMDVSGVHAVSMQDG